MKFHHYFITLISMLPFLFTQCSDIEYNKRVLVKGKVSNPDHEGQKDLFVYTAVGASNILGQSITDASGAFEVTSLSSSTLGMRLFIELPEEFQFETSTDQPTIDKFSLPLYNFQDEIINLNHIRIYPFAEVKINFNRETDGVLTYQLNRNFHQSLSSEFFFVEPNIDLSEEASAFFNLTTDGGLDEHQQAFSIHEIVQKNQDIELIYQVNNQ